MPGNFHCEYDRQRTDFSALKSVISSTMRRANKSPQTISRLLDRLEATREELLTIQRSLEELEPIAQSLKIVSRRKLTLPIPKKPLS